MNLSMKWLNDYCKPDVTIKEFADDLTMSGSKVEGYRAEGDELSRVVVGHVISVEKHSNADSLFICKIDVSSEDTLQIVTGADNVIAGSFVPVALDGSVLTGGKKIKSGKLRGELSQGMLCSLSELSLTKNDFPYAVEDGIFILGDDCDLTPGKDIREAIGLNDTVVEFEITSNRPDCLSVLGLARETAATYNIKYNAPQPKVSGGGGNVGDFISVDINNSELCLRYAAAAVSGVKVEPSPRWLRERLRAAGVRPINNIVDITNYVMLEYGHPMHAFDLRHVAGNKIIVRNAVKGETITTLDGIERQLSEEMLVIADEKNPSAVAGVMGGEFSGVYDDTATVIFEAACFDGASVRTTAKKLGMRTESSARFEKGLDPETCMPALMRACQLVEMLNAGKVADGFVDVYPTKKQAVVLDLNPGWINEFLGINIPREDMVDYLRRLEFIVDGDKVTAPSFRGDIECAADIAEEIARIYGYNNIPATAIKGTANGGFTPEQKFERSINQTLIAAGYSEVITYSFISPKFYDKIRLPSDSALRNSVTISNPLGEDTSVMRTTALPSMLEVLARNFHNRNQNVRLYEIATEYSPVKGERLPNEKKRVMIGAYGGGCDFLELKGAVELLLDRAGIKDYDIKVISDNPAFHPGRCAGIVIGDAEIGIMGEIHPETAENYDVSAKMYVADLNLALLFNNANTEKHYKPLPRFPASTRDLAIVCDEALPVLTIQNKISQAAGNLLENIVLFDVYHGAQVGQNKKSVAYSLTLRAPDRTLTDEECDKVVEKALKLLKEIGAEIRA